MTFEELRTKVKTLKCEEFRVEDSDYIEVVVAKTELAAMLTVLDSCFGPPLKPVGEDPSDEANRYAEPHGGVRDNQTLYYRKNEKGHELALLWPWGSGLSVTVKMIRE